MQVKFFFISSFIILNLFFSCSHFSLYGQESQSEVPYILVSVAPHKYFVEKVAGDTVKVGLLVPAGASAHTYEPTPRQMIQASKASMWFRIGEGFEARAIRAIQAHRPEIVIVDLREGLDLIGGEDEAHGSCCCCHCNSMDLHFWLSPRLNKIQAETIANTLIEAYPSHASLYRERLKMFQEELDQLDQQLKEILASARHTILVSHPAYAYLCRDYGLKQLSIEFEGKDPTPQQLTHTLQLARQNQIQTVFIQKQYSNKGARLVAEDIGAQVVDLDPYAENVSVSLLEIARAFAKG